MKTTNIIRIPKPNKDMNISTSYRPISLLSVIAKNTREGTTPIHHKQHPTHISTQHGFKNKHSTALHNINNTIATGLNQNKPPERTITVVLDMCKAFGTVNIHTLTHKLHQTTSHTPLSNTSQTTSKTAKHTLQGGVLSPTLFNIYPSDTPIPQAPVKLTTCADDINTQRHDHSKSNHPIIPT